MWLIVVPLLFFIFVFFIYSIKWICVLLIFLLCFYFILFYFVFLLYLFVFFLWSGIDPHIAWLSRSRRVLLFHYRFVVVLLSLVHMNIPCRCDSFCSSHLALRCILDTGSGNSPCRSDISYRILFCSVSSAFLFGICILYRLRICRFSFHLIHLVLRILRRLYLLLISYRCFLVSWCSVGLLCLGSNLVLVDLSLSDVLFVSLDLFYCFSLVSFFRCKCSRYLCLWHLVDSLILYCWWESDEWVYCWDDFLIYDVLV